MVDAQQKQQRCSESTECSPRKLARRIEGCIVRNALDEEERAQKALFLLRARDRRIAFLENRVIELEVIAADIHQHSLRNSSRTSTLEQDKASSEFARSEKSLKTDDESVDRDFTTADSTRDSFDKKLYDDCDSATENRMSVPCLKLSRSSTTNSEELYSASAIELPLNEKNRSVSNSRICKKSPRDEDVVEKDLEARKRESKSRSVDEELALDVEKIPVGEKEVCRSDEGLKVCEKKGVSSVSMGNVQENVYRVSRGKQQRHNYMRTSSSVPWIRAKRGFRKKLRGVDLKTAKRPEVLLPAGDGRSPFPAFGMIEKDRRAEEAGIVRGAKKAERSLVSQGQEEAFAKRQGARLIAETKSTFTQTSPVTNPPNNKSSQTNDVATIVKNSTPSCVYLQEKKSQAIWSVDEDPAPQWLIEEALNRETQHSERWTKGDASTGEAIEYESIVSELEEKLTRAKTDLDEALKSKSLAKEKYRRSLENAKVEARKENEVLQERIVRICTSVLENFGPRVNIEKRRCSYPIKGRRRLRYHEIISNKLHKKLRMAFARSNKLKEELTNARKELKSKSEKCESISKCFDRLKQEAENTELNLNNLISENVSLRKKIEDTRDWMEHNVGKEQHDKINTTHFRDMQRSRELTNLRKKTEEDFATITQLRNKLLRSESTNANKGFLLNSYKSQLADLNKEKTQLMSKISSLENDLGAVRANNSQLKAKVSVLTNQKDKLVSENEKSKTDLTEKMESRCAKKCEESLQLETAAMKSKYEDVVKSIKVKMIATENQNTEYTKAIKEFLRRLHDYHDKQETQRSINESEASEKEAHDTACNILNMTPEELSGFINGKTPNSINSWILELNRIVAKKNFSENLSKFLFKKMTKKMKA